MADAHRDELRQKVKALSEVLGGDAAVADRAGLGLVWIRMARDFGYVSCDAWRALDRLAAEVAGERG